jgi:cytochrome c-type biogenesis protein CcmH/NrfG
MDTNYASAWAYLGQSYSQKRMHSEALSALQKADSLAGVIGEVRAALGRAYAAAGRIERHLNPERANRLTLSTRHIPPLRADYSNSGSRCRIRRGEKGRKVDVGGDSIAAAGANA